MTLGLSFRGFLKQFLPYGFVERCYGRLNSKHWAIKEFLPFGIVKAFEERLPDLHEISKNYSRSVGRISDKLYTGGRIKCLFFVTSPSLFPAKPLFDAMMHDEAFDPCIIVIPDLRWYRSSPEKEMERCLNELKAVSPHDRVLAACRDAKGEWQSPANGADIVCYPLPYDDIYAPQYAPRNAIKSGFLPISVNYGYFRSIYDRSLMGLNHYAWMWKAFFECEETMDEYRKYSIMDGNADLTGYIKMDSLAKNSVFSGDHSKPCRKRVLVALHHSVEGGTNKTLALANFVRYSDFFAGLPEKYPSIDFTFRPHPFLFKVMAQPAQWGATKTREYIANLKAKPNVTWSDGGDYFREFSVSDACIQDCGSYLVEYFYTKKPCCYMLKSSDDINTKFSPLGRQCLDNCYLAYDTSAIDNFLLDVVLAGNDPKKANRERFADKVMLNFPNAAMVALSHIKDAIMGEKS